MSNARLIVIAITLGHLISTSSQEELYSQQGARLVGKLCSALTQFSSYYYRGKFRGPVRDVLETC